MTDGPHDLRGQPANPSPDVYNVLDFGAEGDGSTDDQAAFHAALDAAALEEKP
jgi:polygalacturonase